MDDYLEKTCVNLGIKLLYTSNKVTVLSAEIRNGIPILRAHKVFKKCTPEVVQAIVGYYTDLANKTKYENIIKTFLKSQFSSNEYKLRSSSISLKDEIVHRIPSDYDRNMNDTSLIEYDITSIVVKDFWGKEEKQIANSPLRTSEDEVLQLDIEVRHPST